ncbi:hypothetical protein [Herbaspirillum robiniae]|uniref:hypothetical protein n=1 Tax=Herbaspirillum robiniae TaxID=2014887 RepID=UPI003D76C48E
MSNETWPGFELIAYDNSKSGQCASRVMKPSWELIESSVRSAFFSGGFVRLDVESPDWAHIRSLEMRSLAGKCRLVAATRDPDPKRELWVWWEDGDAPFRGQTMLNDHMWDDRTVCSDVKMAIDLFHLLFQYDDEGKKVLMRMRSVWDPKV